VLSEPSHLLCQVEDKRTRSGVPLTPDEAIRKIQAAARGFIWRRRIQRLADREAAFIGMLPKVA
jgi:IQ and AAA domain-containing protein